MPPIFRDAIIYANLILILTIGFTLTYLIAKIPNFAHGTYAGIGVYTIFNAVKIWNVNPYISVPIAFLIGAGLGAFIYTFVIRTLKKFGATSLSITISTLALQMIIYTIVNIYADWIRVISRTYSRDFLFRYADFHIFGQPGVLLISTVLVLLLIVTIQLVLTKTKFGIAMRATVEDPALASMMGVDVEKISTISWAATAGLASLAGSIFPLWFQGSPDTGNLIMTSVFAASVLGGLSSIYGAMIGGYIIGLSEILGVSFLARIIGPWIAAYRMLIPLIILVIVLLFTPLGFMGLIEEYQAKKITTQRSVNEK